MRIGIPLLPDNLTSFAARLFTVANSAVYVQKGDKLGFKVKDRGSVRVRDRARVGVRDSVIVVG